MESLDRRQFLGSLLLAIGAGFSVNARTAYGASVSEDVLIVPGKSVGRVSIGMSPEKVEEVLGPPTKSQPGYWTEYKNGSDVMHVFFIDGSVNEIRFNSKKFRTADGLSLANLTQKRWHDRFEYGRLQIKFMNTRQILKSGGLAMYRINLDATPGIPVEYSGLVYAGAQPKHQPVQYAGEADGGWEPWNGDGSTLFDTMIHQNPGGFRDMGD